MDKSPVSSAWRKPEPTFLLNIHQNAEQNKLALEYGMLSPIHLPIKITRPMDPRMKEVKKSTNPALHRYTCNFERGWGCGLSRPGTMVFETLQGKGLSKMLILLYIQSCGLWASVVTRKINWKNLNFKNELTKISSN